MIRDDRSAIPRTLWIVGAIALIALILGLIFDRAHFFEAYLFAFLFWLALSLGTLVLAMISQITGGRWGTVIGQPAAAAAAAIPVLALLFLPVLFGLHHLYPWTVGAGAPADVLQHKALFLNEPFFIARAVIYLLVWSAMAWLFRARWQHAAVLDRPADWRRLRRVSALGLLLYAVTGTLAAVDWIMSLLPVWYSTVFGSQVLAMQLLAATALLVLTIQPLERSVVPQQRAQDFHDLGNLMLVFTLLWAYLAYSDYLTIWIGDLPHETEWYRDRGSPLWQGLAIAVWVLQFAIPLVLLLFRTVKRNPERMRVLASAVLIGSFLNAYWLVVPTVRSDHALVSWLDPVALIALGCVWLALFLLQLRRDERTLQPSVGRHAHAQR